MEGSGPPVSAELDYVVEALREVSYTLCEIREESDNATIKCIMDTLIRQERILTRLSKRLRTAASRAAGPSPQKEKAHPATMERPVSEELLHMRKAVQDISWDLARTHASADPSAGLQIEEIAKALILQGREMLKLSKQPQDNGL